jgi:biotin-(acetyl-CoA carboxylase) ligase
VNDLILADHKVGGVISATHVQGDLVAHLLLGIGVNVAASPAVPRDPRVPAAGSLAALAGADAPGLRELAFALLRELDRAIDDLVAGRGADLVAAYQERSVVVGREVAIWPVAEDAPAGEPLLRGRVLAVRDDLGLELEGHAEAVYVGRLTLQDG